MADTQKVTIEKLDMLCDTAFQDLLSSRPFYASQLGYPSYLGELPDISEDRKSERRSSLKAWLEAARELRTDGLSEEQQISRELLIGHCMAEITTLDVDAESYTVTPLPQTGIVAAMLVSMPKSELRSGEDCEAYLDRCRKVPGWLGQAEELLREGSRRGCHPVSGLVQKSIAQLDQYLGSEVDDDPLVTVPGAAEYARAGWREALAEVVFGSLRGALKLYRQFLADEVLPKSRPDDLVGLVNIPGGEDAYPRLIEKHTTTSLSPDDIHNIGLALVEELTSEMEELGSRLLHARDFADTLRELRSNPALLFSSAEEIVQTAREAMERASTALPRWLQQIPEAACVVREMPSLENENGDLGHYQWPGEGGIRPGTYWINTLRPAERPRYEAETLAFHESIPGHHTQIALAHELKDVSDFRRHVHVTAFSEGWALYVERLGQEMGIYNDEFSQFGMVSFDFWRACRLVVDTGMHARGWSRQQAVEYMWAHSALTRKNIENEVDRYIGWPGQALGYMLGRLEIRKQRERVTAAIGPKVSLAEFHYELLRHGALELPQLGRIMDSWVGAVRGRA